MSTVAHFTRRKIEAEMIGRIYQQMCATIDPAIALEILTTTIENAAVEEGQRFATQANGEPSLSHFKTVLADWDEALQVEMIEETENVLRFNVADCEYIRAYKNAGLPQELVKLLSCHRDAAFARGYSKQIEFTRQGTLAEGSPHCDFCYQWHRARK